MHSHFPRRRCSARNCFRCNPLRAQLINTSNANRCSSASHSLFTTQHTPSNPLSPQLRAERRASLLGLVSGGNARVLVLVPDAEGCEDGQHSQHRECDPLLLHGVTMSRQRSQHGSISTANVRCGTHDVGGRGLLVLLIGEHVHLTEAGADALLHTQTNTSPFMIHAELLRSATIRKHAVQQRHPLVSTIHSAPHALASHTITIIDTGTAVRPHLALAVNFVRELRGRGGELASCLRDQHDRGGDVAAAAKAPQAQSVARGTHDSNIVVCRGYSRGQLRPRVLRNARNKVEVLFRPLVSEVHVLHRPAGSTRCDSSNPTTFRPQKRGYNSHTLRIPR